jgi:hypothetical protein
MTPIAIPHGAYGCTPFSGWQRSLARLHSLAFGALDAAGLGIADLAAIKSHTPFAVNDILHGCAAGDTAMAVVVRVS